MVTLGEIGGLCPEGPRLQGSYRVAGLAYYAHTRDIRDNKKPLEGMQTVDTYSVAMSPALPVIEIPVEITKTTRPLIIIPACRNQSLNPKGNCSIANYTIIRQDDTSGEIFVAWDDSEQGGDFDQDMSGVLKYEITGTKITVETDVFVATTESNYAMGFGYIINGVTFGDDYHAHSGINGFENIEVDDDGVNFGCSGKNVGCDVTDGYCCHW